MCLIPFRTGKVVVAGVFLWSASVLFAAPETAPQEPQTEKIQAPEESSAISDRYRQLADEPVPRLVPVQPRSEEEQRRLDALSHFMTGQLYLKRGQIEKGRQQLRQAIEINPNVLDSYQLFVQASMQSGHLDEAQAYALKATEHTANGVGLLRALAIVLLQQGKVDQATALLQDGLKLPHGESHPFRILLLHRHLAQCYRVQNKIEKAADSYQILLEGLQGDAGKKLTAEQRKALIGHPGKFYEELGQAFLLAKRPEQAVKAYEEAAKHSDKAVAIHGYNLATVFHQTGDTPRALEELEKYLNARLDVKGQAPYQLLKTLLKELDRSEELISRLEELRVDDQRNKSLAYFLADEYLQAGQFDKAKQIYKKTGGGVAPESLVGLAMIARKENDYPLWLKHGGRAFATLQLGNRAMFLRLNAQSRALGQRFLDDMEELAKDHKQLEELLKLSNERLSKEDLEFEEAWLVGRITILADRTEEAERFYRYAISMQNVPEIELFRELGAHLVDQEEYKKAEQVFQQAANHPSLAVVKPFFLSLISIAREMDGRIDAALEAIREAQQLNPEQPEYALQEARIYYRARRWEEAAEEFEEIIRANPDKPDLIRDCQFSLSAVYVQLNDFERGEQILLDILKEDPENIQANNDLGYLWADRNENLDKALPMIKKALAAEPENPAYLDSLGWVFYRMGKFEKALDNLQKASQHPRGEDSTILDHLGDCQNQLGQHKQAKQSWQQALEIEEKKSFPDEKLLESLKQKLSAAASEKKEAGATPDSPDPDK